LLLPALSSQDTINPEFLNTNKPSCLNLEEAPNAKQDKKSRLSKPGEGANHPKVRNRKLGNRIKGKACRLKAAETMERTEMERRGLFLCHATCRRTGRFCQGIFLHKSGLTKHEVASKHDFPIGIHARDWLRLQASKPGGVLAAGGRPDRQSDSLYHKIEAALLGSPGELPARCFGEFNRKSGHKGYKKPPRLLQVLRELFAIEPKLRAQEMQDRMREMRDEDGGLLFCYSKRFTTGLLLSYDQIQSWISSETQKKKTKKKDPKTEQETKEEKLIQELNTGQPF
jgi:hypothetical protein